MKINFGDLIVLRLKTSNEIEWIAIALEECNINRCYVKTLNMCYTNDNSDVEIQIDSFVSDFFIIQKTILQVLIM